MIYVALLVAFLLGLIHVLDQWMSKLETDPRSRSLSMAGGVTVAFIFLYLLPELAEFRRLLTNHHAVGDLEELIYLVSLVGVIVYYGLDHLAYRKRGAFHQPDADDRPFGHDYVFWLHMGWYALYNVIVGILLVSGEQESPRGLLLYGLAMGLHFVVIDASLRKHHRHVYKMTGCWILAVAVIAGWALGAFLPVSEEVLAVITAFLFGGMLINAIKDEMPSEQETRVFPFLVGAAAYTALLMII